MFESNGSHHKTPVRMAGILAEIQAKYLLNAIKQP